MIAIKFFSLQKKLSMVRLQTYCLVFLPPFFLEKNKPHHRPRLTGNKTYKKSGTINSYEVLQKVFFTG